MQRFEDFQVAQSREVEGQIIASLIKGNARQVRNVPPQMLGKIMQHPARRSDGRRPVFQSEPIEGRHFEMLAHREQRRFRRKDPVVVAVEDPAAIRRKSSPCASTVWGGDLRLGVWLDSPRGRGPRLP